MSDIVSILIQIIIIALGVALGLLIYDKIKPR